MNRKYSTFPVTAESLRGCRFFDDQDEQSRARIARLCEGRTYKAGAEIIRHQGKGSEVFFIISGRVRANTHTLDGKVVTFQGLRSDEMFGEVSALDGYPRSTDVVAATETKVLVLSGRDFRELITSTPDLADRTIRRLCELIRHLVEKAYDPRAYSVPDQIRREVFREFRRAITDLTSRGERVRIAPPPTHREVAQSVGTTREQVTRVIGGLSDQGLMYQEGRTWVADDVDRLMALLEERLNPVNG